MTLFGERTERLIGLWRQIKIDITAISFTTTASPSITMYSYFEKRKLIVHPEKRLREGCFDLKREISVKEKNFLDWNIIVLNQNKFYLI